MSEKRRDQKGRILLTGESQRKDGRYEYKYKEGDKRRSVYATTLKELREKEKEIKRKLDSGCDMKLSRMTMGECIDLYYQNKNIRDTTKRIIAEDKQRIAEAGFLDKRLCDITPYDCQVFVGRISQRYARGTIEHMYSRIKTVLNYAVNNDFIEKNPMRLNIKDYLPEPRSKEKFLSDERFDEIIEIMTGSNFEYYIPYFMILIETGLRVSELCGLTEDCIDFEHHKLTVNKQIGRDKGKPIVVKPKTKSSENWIPLTDEAEKNLRIVLDRWDHRISVDGIDGFFILNKTGTNVVTRITIEGVFLQVKQHYNKKYPEKPMTDFHPHMLRHTAASRMIRAGVPLSTIQRVLRHSTLETTVQVYSHPFEDQIIDDVRGS